MTPAETALASTNASLAVPLSAPAEGAAGWGLGARPIGEAADAVGQNPITQHGATAHALVPLKTGGRFLDRSGRRGASMTGGGFLGDAWRGFKDIALPVAGIAGGAAAVYGAYKLRQAGKDAGDVITGTVDTLPGVIKTAGSALARGEGSAGAGEALAQDTGIRAGTNKVVKAGAPYLTGAVNASVKGVGHLFGIDAWKKGTGTSVADTNAALAGSTANRRAGGPKRSNNPANVHGRKVLAAQAAQGKERTARVNDIAFGGRQTDGDDEFFDAGSAPAPTSERDLLQYRGRGLSAFGGRGLGAPPSHPTFTGPGYVGARSTAARRQRRRSTLRTTPY